MDELSIIVSLLFLLTISAAYLYSGGFFSVAFLIMLYISFLYLGSLNFYFTQGHLTFVFVFLMALFYLIGLILGKKFTKPKPFKDPIKIYNPLNSSILKLSMLFIFLLSLSLSFYWVKKFGIPLFERAWYTTGIEATTGIYNRMLFSTGIQGLLIISLLCYGMYKVQKESFFKYLFLFSFFIHVIFTTLVGGKAVAIMPFLLILMTMFYTNRRISKKLLAIGGTLALLLALFIGFFWTDTFSLYKTFMLFYTRTTYDAVLHLDYLLYEYAPNHSYQFGQTVLLELKRIIAQITSIPKEPLFNEIIGNLREGAPIYRVTGISPEISLFGMAYANFGIVGAIFTAIIFGFIVQCINIYFISRKSINLFSFGLWIFFMYKLLGLVRSGNVLISLQSFLIEILPITALIFVCYLSLALPFPNALKWKKLHYTRRNVNETKSVTYN